MNYYYKTTIFLKFNQHLTNSGNFHYTRQETVTATGKTINDSENAALLEAAMFTTNNPNDKIIYELQTIKIKSNHVF
jgi:hypothetical protein